MLKIDNKRPLWSRKSWPTYIIVDESFEQEYAVNANQRYVIKKSQSIDQANYSLRNRSNSSGETDNASANRQIFNKAILRCPRSTPPK